MVHVYGAEHCAVKGLVRICGVCRAVWGSCIEVLHVYGAQHCAVREVCGVGSCLWCVEL